MKSTLFIAFFLLWGQFIGHAQFNEDYHFILDSEHLDEARDIWVSLPKFYHQNNYSCHTLYLFDADFYQNAQTIKAIRNQLFENGGYINPLIIVGIEQKDRSKELNPYGETGNPFFQFLEEEVIPTIDSLYHTNGDRIIAGHSLGGQFALHTWMKSRKINSCYAFSPAIYNNNSQIIKDLDQYLKAQQPKGIVYVNNGTDDTTEQLIKKHIDDLKKAFDHGMEELFFQYKEYEGYGHNFTPIVGMTDALLFHFSKWNMTDELKDQLWNKEVDPISAYESHYEKLDRWAGFRVERKSSILHNLAYHYYNTNEHEKALELVNYALEIDPTDGFSYMRKGEILAKKDKVAARTAFIKALLYLQPEDVFEHSKNFREYEFYKEIIEGRLNALED